MQTWNWIEIMIAHAAPSIDGRDVGSSSSSAQRVLRAALGLRLRHKILIANAVIVGICAIAAAVLARWTPAGSFGEAVALAALAGMSVSVAVNALLIRLALDPLGRLQGAAARVRAGDLAARAPLSPLADRELAHLITTFNGTLDQLTLSRGRLRTIAARALETAEDERKRIARELHDDTAQTLTSLLIRLRTVRNAGTEAERTRLLDELRDELSDAIERMRRFAHGLRPPALDMLGLVPALESHARKVGEFEGLMIDIEADDVAGLLDAPAELALYRIVQEALSNVARHARAKHVRITVRYRADRIVAVVDDDGRGFDPEDMEAQPDRGLGLFGMEERAAYIGGRVDVRSERGKGTHVRIEIPVGERHSLVHHV